MTRYRVICHDLSYDDGSDGEEGQLTTIRDARRAYARASEEYQAVLQRRVGGVWVTVDPPPSKP